MILTREAAGQRIHRRTVLEYALESQSQSASVTVIIVSLDRQPTYFPYAAMSKVLGHENRKQ